jgi:hypothetical protein
VRIYRPANGTIQSVAGIGRKGAAGVGGPPLAALLNLPHGVTVGPGESLYISDSGNNRILKIAR